MRNDSDVCVYLQSDFSCFMFFTFKNNIKKELKGEDTFPVKIKKEKGCEEETNTSVDTLSVSKGSDQISLKVERESSSVDKGDSKQDTNLKDVFESKDRESEGMDE